MLVDDSGHSLFGDDVSVEAVQGKGWCHSRVKGEGSGNVDVGLGADEGVDFGKGCLPVVYGGFVEGFLDAGRVDRRKGHEDGCDAVVDAFLLDGFQVLDDVFGKGRRLLSCCFLP